MHCDLPPAKLQELEKAQVQRIVIINDDSSLELVTHVLFSSTEPETYLPPSFQYMSSEDWQDIRQKCVVHVGSLLANTEDDLWEVSMQ